MNRAAFRLIELLDFNFFLNKEVGLNCVRHFKFKDMLYMKIKSRSGKLKLCKRFSGNNIQYFHCGFDSVCHNKSGH